MDHSRTQTHHPRACGIKLCVCGIGCTRLCSETDLLPISGADVVEVAPAYDNGVLFSFLLVASMTLNINAAEITGIAAADLVHEMLSLFVTGKAPASWAGSPLRDEL